MGTLKHLESDLDGLEVDLVPGPRLWGGSVIFFSTLAWENKYFPKPRFWEVGKKYFPQAEIWEYEKNRLRFGVKINHISLKME